jgi:hypothetical protein
VASLAGSGSRESPAELRNAAKLTPKSALFGRVSQFFRAKGFKKSSMCLALSSGADPPGDAGPDWLTASADPSCESDETNRCQEKGRGLGHDRKRE